MKKIIGLILSFMMVIIACFSVAGCGGQEEPVHRLVELETGPRYCIYYDRETRVMYLLLGRDCNSGGLTVMLDEDGKPLLYQGE